MKTALCAREVRWAVGEKWRGCLYWDEDSLLSIFFRACSTHSRIVSAAHFFTAKMHVPDLSRACCSQPCRRLAWRIKPNPGKPQSTLLLHTWGKGPHILRSHEFLLPLDGIVTACRHEISARVELVRSPSWRIGGHGRRQLQSSKAPAAGPAAPQRTAQAPAGTAQARPCWSAGGTAA